MEEGNYVSSKILIELQGELIRLSNSLNELHNALSQAVRMANNQWKDGKYEEFVTAFRSSMEKVNELSEKYKEWAKSYLPPRIEEAKNYEGVSGDIS